MEPKSLIWGALDEPNVLGYCVSMANTQTSEQASAKLLRFPTREACQAFLDAHRLYGNPRNVFLTGFGDHWIGVCSLSMLTGRETEGICGYSSPDTAELLPDW